VGRSTTSGTRHKKWDAARQAGHGTTSGTRHDKQDTARSAGRRPRKVKGNSMVLTGEV
jgi:hypothetical protein